MDKIDFRSDTVSWPTPAMREAMATAPVGDDVYGEDPTVNQLEAMAAEMMGKAAALFVVSGTMGNLTAVLSHAGRGDEAILGDDSHIHRSEAGGMAALGGVMPRPLATDKYGRMQPAEVETAVRPDNPHYPRTRLILLENSYGNRAGYPLPPAYFADMHQVAQRHGLAIHLDGARLFNTAVALNIAPKVLTQYVDSVTFCLSKGLSAPVGSLLCGSADFIHQARRIRKSIGGGMRQAGILAAAGIVALTQSPARLHADHDRARRLGAALHAMPGVQVDLEMVQTNMVFFALDAALGMTAQELADQLRREANMWVSPLDRLRLRAVTHQWITDDDVDGLITAMHSVLTKAYA